MEATNLEILLLIYLIVSVTISGFMVGIREGKNRTGCLTAMVTFFALILIWPAVVLAVIISIVFDEDGS